MDITSHDLPFCGKYNGKVLPRNFLMATPYLQAVLRYYVCGFNNQVMLCYENAEFRMRHIDMQSAIHGFLFTFDWLNVPPKICNQRLPLPVFDIGSPYREV